MAPGDQRSDGIPGGGGTPTGLFESLRAALVDATEGDRYRLLAAVFGEFADVSSGSGNGRPAGSQEEFDSLARKVHALTEEKASLRDRCAALKADLDHRGAQLEAEQTRAHELERLRDEQRARLDLLQKEFKSAEAQIVAKNAELHKTRLENEQRLLETQRSAVGRDDSAKVERIESANRDLTKQVEALRADLERVRADKDVAVASLKDELTEAQSGAAATAGVPFDELWQRLASRRPPLVDAQVQPNRQSAQRVADSLAELVRFVDDFDKLLRPFLSKYTKHHAPVKVPWDVYVKGDDARTTLVQTLAPVGGKPFGVAKIRLRVLYAWTEASLIASDAAVECISSELHSFLLGPSGVGSDPNGTIKGFLSRDGHELFLQHMRELRARKLAEAFGRGG